MVAAIHKELPTASFIVPMPPSKQRRIQPLIILGKKVAELLNIPFFENILLKVGNTPQMKDIGRKEEKIEALLGCFQINDTITNDGQSDVLIIDDLYSSGASLSATTQTMRTYAKVGNVYVAAFTKTKLKEKIFKLRNKQLSLFPGADKSIKLTRNSLANFGVNSS